MLSYLTMAVVAALVSAGLAPGVRRLAASLGAVDAPGGRRVHEGVIPRLGGLTLLGGITAALITSEVLGVHLVDKFAARGWDIEWIFAGVLMVFGVGIIDDLHGLRPIPKLIGQSIGASCAIIGGVLIAGFTNPLTGELIELGALGGLVTLLWLVGVTNAFNLVDGLDGLASGVAVIAALTVTVSAFAQDRTEIAIAALVLTGAGAGFLWHNFHPATIFLGDSGAFLLGFSLAVLAILGLQKGPTIAVLAVPVMTLGFPIIETLVTIQRRIATVGTRRVLESDDDHIHHRLIGGGMSKLNAVLLLWTVSAALGTLACLSVLIGGPGSALAAVLIAVALYLGLRRLGYLRGVRPNRADPY